MIEAAKTVKINDLIVQSNELIEAYYDSELTTLEHKFIRYVASKIKKNDSHFPDYTITVKEFAEVMNVKGNNYHNQVRDLADDLTRKRIKIRSSKDKMGWFPWFAGIIYDSGIVHVSFNPLVKEYLISLDSRFTGYSFDNIKNLKSGYTVRLFELLKQYEKIGKRTVELEELKKMIGVGEKYPVYGNFKQRILNVAKKELEKTGELYFTFKEIKQGRKTSAIEFTILSKNKQQSSMPKESEDFLETIKKALMIHGIVITDKKILTWKKFGVESVLDVLEEIKNRDIDNHANYISKVLRNKQDQKVEENNPIGELTNVEQDKKIENNKIDSSLIKGAIQVIVAKYARGKELLPDYFIEKEVISLFTSYLDITEEVATGIWNQNKKLIMYQIKTKKEELLSKKYSFKS